MSWQKITSNFSKLKPRQWLVFVVCFYLLATIIFTWPILPNINTKLADNQDPYLIYYMIDAEIAKVRTGDFQHFWDGNILYPYPNTLAFTDHALTLTLEASPLVLLGAGPALTVNYLNLLAFFLSAIFAYLLAYHYTENRAGSLLAGLIYGFAAYHIGQWGHVNIASYQFIPLAVLAFEKFLKTPKLHLALFFSGAFLLNEFVSFGHAIYLSILLSILMLIRILSKNLLFSKKLFGFGMIALLIIGIPTWLITIKPLATTSANLNVVRPLSDLLQYSATSTAFLSAPENNLAPRITEMLWHKNFSFPYNNEHTLYLGIFTITVALSSIVSLRKGLKSKQTWLIFSFLTVIIFGYLYAFGPYFRLPFGITFTSPYLWLYHHVILFKATRVPTRIMIIVLLAVAMLSAFSVKKIMQTTKLNKLTKQIIIIIIFSGVFFEQLCFPLKLNNELPLNTALYTWTSDNLPKEAVVAHFPFWQRYQYYRGMKLDRRRTFTGYSGIDPESTYRIYNASLSPEFYQNPTPVLSVLATLGVDYLIIHPDLPDEFGNVLGERKINLPAEVELIKTIDHDQIYRISQLKNTNYFVTPTNIYVDKRTNKEITLVQTNDSKQIWVNQNLQKFNLSFKYYANGKLIAEKNKALFQPLYLMPTEKYQTQVTIPGVLGKKWDEVKIKTSEAQ
ncbi:MAG: hypothetical protein WCJ58_05780 [bacterium]